MTRDDMKFGLVVRNKLTGTVGTIVEADPARGAGRVSVYNARSGRTLMCKAENLEKV